MLGNLCDILICPRCGGDLSWSVVQQTSDRIVDGMARCVCCDATYPVQNEIGVFLTPEQQTRRDGWKDWYRWVGRLEDGLVDQLMSRSMEELSPADLSVRVAIHHLRGEYIEAAKARQIMIAGAYTAELNAAMERQFQFVVDQLRKTPSSGPILDVATGLGRLFQAMVDQVDGPLIASDISPFVLGLDRELLIRLGLYNNVGLVAFDFHRVPFREKAIGHVTSLLGYGDISALKELHRVCSGQFLSVTWLYPEDDVINGEAIAEFDDSMLFYRKSTIEAFSAAGWRAVAANSLTARALPTPTGEIIQGETIDGLPVAETMLEICTIVAAA